MGVNLTGSARQLDGKILPTLLQVNLGTQREHPLWETFTIIKKEGADGSSYALSCVTERSPAHWQDLTGAFEDPINDMCAGNSDLWVETKQRTKRGAYGEVHTTYAYTFSFKDASDVEKLVHLVSQRYAFAAEVRRGGGGAALLTASGKGDGMVIDGLGPDGISARVLDAARGAVKLQTGYVYHYALAMLLGVVALATWFIAAGGGL